MPMIFVTEDDEGIKELIEMALKSFSYEVRLFDNAEETLEAANESVPDLFLFDIMLPGMDGITAVKKLRSRKATQKTPIIMLTAKDTEIDKVVGLDAGADDYLVKPFGIMELAARIRALLRRNTNEETAIKSGRLELNASTREVKKDNMVVELTYKEFELLKLLMQNMERVVPREELLNTVWGIDFEGETRTLDAHIKSLRQKLGDIDEDNRMIKTVRNVGYRFVPTA